MSRPDYCPDDLDESKPCPACGATADGNDPVRGICQARYRGPDPKTWMPRIVLVDRQTGAVI